MTEAVHVRMGASIGQPLTRRDGFLKTTGAARFAADAHHPDMLFAALAVSHVARGHVTKMDVAAAKAHPGVISVMTPDNAPKLAMDPDEKQHHFMMCLDLLQNDQVRYAGQPIAVVIAESLESAVEGAALLAPQYQAEAPCLGLDMADGFFPDVAGEGSLAAEAHGDLAAGLAAATRRMSLTYDTPAQYHNPMEPHAIVAEWQGDHLTVDTTNQFMALAVARIAGLFGIPDANILIRCQFLGGGFGCKAFISGPQILAIMAARLVDRPVKLVLSRAQMYGPVGHRPQTRQAIELAADREGRLTALSHHLKATTSAFDVFLEPAANISRTLYAATAIATSHEAVRNDIGTPLYMRAPGEAPGSAALESAMDEMAEAYGMDPLAFRLKNYAEVEPISGKPYSSKALRECYAQGAARFGWVSRPLAPRQMRSTDGKLIGWGMGTAIFPTKMYQGAARAILRHDGTGLVETGLHDMGQGATTAFVQIAADALGLDQDKVTLITGHSALPSAGLAGGSAHTATTGTAVLAAGQEVIAKLADLATQDVGSPLFGAGNVGVIARKGWLHRRDNEAISQSYAEILTRAGLPEIDGAGSAAMDAQAADTYAMHAHGAVFAEVQVDPDLGQMRVTRLVGAFAAGRIVNPHLVRSQYHGGMVWGLSFALHEHAVIDTRSGRVMNANLGDYHIPVSADLPAIEAILVDEVDPHVNPLGVKGVGEIGITGTVGAIANAVYHATGKRIRQFPITLDRLL